MAKNLTVGEYAACLAKDPWKEHLHVDHAHDLKVAKKPETTSLLSSPAEYTLPIPTAKDMKPHINSSKHWLTKNTFNLIQISVLDLDYLEIFSYLELYFFINLKKKIDN